MTDESIDTTAGELPKTLGIWEFTYVNWRGDRHRYVVDFTAGHAPGYGADPDGDRAVSGRVITCDGDPRENMGNNRRRTFKVAEMHNVEVVA